MATIDAFSAIMPASLPLELELLKHRLEPHGEGAGSPTLADCRDFLANMLESKGYAVEEDALYIYGHESAAGLTKYGVWAVTSLDDVAEGNIVPHEQTLAELEAQILAYRAQVGLEGSAVLLCYVPNDMIDHLISLCIEEASERRIRYGEVVHRVWKVSKPHLIAGLKRAFSLLSKVYVADGHHRLAAARRMHWGTPQFISSLYLAFDQLEIAAFHRLVRMGDFDRSNFTRSIAHYYHLNYMPDNKGYRPTCKGNMGLFFSGVWYMLSPRIDVKALMDLPDTQLLQSRILDGVLGITDPATDKRLECYNDGYGWEQLQVEIAKDSSVIVFTLFPMKAEEFMDCADLGISLPPKSTFMVPKPPYGILMYDGKARAERSSV